MDTFCLNCHDTNGASTINVATGNATLNLNSTRALTPFNTNDNLRNGRDGFTTRTRVTNVKTQFTTTNPSHHAVLGARYTTTNTNWVAGTWTAHVVRNTGLTGAGVSNVTRERATLHCSDCHLAESNAHGARNAWHMLMNGTPNDYTTDTAMTATKPGASLVCYKCHNQNVYTGNNKTGVTGSRWTHFGDETNWFGADYGATNDGTNLGPQCLNCHSGDNFGNIHGVSGTYNPSSPTLPPTGTTYTRYRFMPGAWMQWAPGGSGGSDTSWNQTNATSTCYFPSSSSWSNCTSHSGNNRGSSTNYARPTTY